MKLNDEEFRVLKEVSGGAKLITRSSGASYVKQQQGNVWAVTRSAYSSLQDKGLIEKRENQPHKEATEHKLSKKGYWAFKRNQTS